MGGITVKHLKNNTKKFTALLFALLFSMSIAGCNMIEKTPEAIEKSPVAKVGKKTITRGELDTYPILAEQLTKLKEQFGGDLSKNAEIKDQLIQFKSQVLEQMIQEEIVFEKSEELKVDNAKVEKEVDKNLKNFMDQGFQGNKDKYKEDLKKMGTTEESIKRFFKAQVITEEVSKQVVKDVKVDDNTAKKHYEESKYTFTVNKPTFHAQHVLVKTEEEAKKVKARLDKGEDIKKIAKELSIDPSAKENSGDLGKAPYSSMVKPFADAIVKLNKGEISQPVKSQFGYHVIKLIDKDEVTFKDFNSVKEQIKKDLLETEKRKVFNEKIEQWKKELKVETKKYEKNII
ncbi:peptidylprolyl isomerase [Clostridium tetani]|nr:peptidylprolyl isomerase [Clostridium tetani]RXI53153.1 peptidylprolyl isomerase [Clostridium tetani]RXI56008.1 peptidylprolyl isomerase [Clostridium tetani]RXI74268.1 peptidylprolyl isomerase [Clostridium tetani]RXI78167.1 peptidylprolyl isomerase [Clostridium tetani]